MQSHEITTEWVPADDSRNHLELAGTEKEGLVAIRDSYDPDRTVFCTTRQLGQFVSAAETGRMKRILGKTMSP